MRTCVAGAIAALCALALVPSTAGSVVLEPTRKDDPIPNGCKPKDCSLREAIMRANRDEEPDRIILERGRYRIELPDSGIGDDDASGEFRIEHRTNVIGEGRRTKVDGQGVDSVFFLGAPSASGVLRDLRVTGGIAKDESGSPDVGGGIAIGQGEAILKRISIDHNTAMSGGGLWTASNDLKIVNSTIDSNTATGSGGGIYSGSAVVPANAEIVASTVSRNSATGLGGGLYLNGSDPAGAVDPSVRAENVTFAENRANVSGGAVATIQGSDADLDNATIAYNVADFDSSGGGNGGGVFQSTSGTASISDSILSNNSVGTTGFGANCAEGAASGITGEEDVVAAPGTDECGLTGWLDASAGIGSLGDFGGPTETVPLLTGSIALGKLTSTGSCPERDQRGKSRPDVGCDAGAFERKGP